MNILKSLLPYITPKAETRRFLYETKEQKEKLQNLLMEYQETEVWKKYFNETISIMTSKMGIMFWRKDKDLRYTLSSPLYCRDFYNLAMEGACLKYLEGRNDKELIKAIYKDNGITNTFEDICYVSDNHTKETRNKCHFFEAGVLNNTQVLLYVIKVPLFVDDQFEGIIGAAWDFSNYSTIMINQLNRWIYDKLAVGISVLESSFVYELKPEIHQCDIFSGVQHNPERDEDRCGCICNHPQCEAKNLSLPA